MLPLYALKRCMPAGIKPTGIHPPAPAASSGAGHERCFAHGSKSTEPRRASPVCQAQSDRRTRVWPDQRSAGFPPVLAARLGPHSWRVVSGVFDPSSAQAVALHVRADHGLARLEGARCAQNGLFQGNMARVNHAFLADSGMMSAVGLLGLPLTGDQQAAHVILGQPPSSTVFLCCDS